MDIKNPKMGGGEIYSWELCKRLVRDGNSVMFLTSGYRSAKKEEEIDGVHIYRSGNILTLFIRGFFWVGQHQREYDLIIEVINGQPFMLPLKLKKLKHTVVIFHLPSFGATCKKLLVIGPLQFILSRVILRYLYNKRNVLTDGENTCRELKRMHFKSVQVAEDGLNYEVTAELNIMEKEKSVVILGPLKPWKRIDHGIRAFSYLPSEWKLNILGGGSNHFLKKLRKIADEMGILDRVNFHGYVDENTKRAIISKSKINIITSEKEGFSLTALECQLYGSVTVAYNFPGVEGSTVPGITSIIAKNGDLNALGGALAALSGDDMKLTTMSKSALEFAKNFTWDLTYNKIMMALKLNFLKNNS